MVVMAEVLLTMSKMGLLLVAAAVGFLVVHHHRTSVLVVQGK